MKEKSLEDAQTELRESTYPQDLANWSLTRALNVIMQQTHLYSPISPHSFLEPWLQHRSTRFSFRESSGHQQLKIGRVILDKQKMSLMVMVAPQSSPQLFAKGLFSFMKQNQEAKIGSTQPQRAVFFFVSAQQSQLNSPPPAFNHSHHVIGIWTKDHVSKLVWNCHCPTPWSVSSFYIQVKCLVLTLRSMFILSTSQHNKDATK